jgi:UDP-glucuronate decarboxylase
MMNSEKDFTGPVNIGTPSEFTIIELAKTLIRMTGSTSRITYRSLPQDDPVQRRPDITVAREKLGWEPRVQLAEGLEKTISYFRGVI